MILAGCGIVKHAERPAMNRIEKQKEEIRLIDLITKEGERDGLQSMSEHPQYAKLKELQNELYPEEKDEDQ